MAKAAPFFVIMYLRLRTGGYLAKRIRQKDLFDPGLDEVIYCRVWVRDLATVFTVSEYHEICRVIKGLTPVRLY